MIDSPLAILGLSPDTATARDIKAAYARLLKTHRPDEDPEGFKRLRSAYEAALRGDEARTAEPLSAPPEAADRTIAGVSLPSPMAAEPAPLAPGVEAALASLHEAVGSRARQRIRDAWEKLDSEAASLSRKDRFQLAMTAFDKAQAKLLVDVCTDERLLAHIHDGEMQLALSALKGWGEQRDGRRIREFVTSLNRARTLHPLPECAIVMVSAAMAMAPWEPDTAGRLMQKAFPVLPTDLRKDMIEKAEHAMALGRLVAPLPEAEKMFWLSCLQGQAPSGHWIGQDDRKLLLNLLNSCGPKWPGFAVLSSVLPAEDWQKLLTALNQLVR